ncbi:flagellar motor protein MotS [Alkalihalobacillus alcalophilus ATCC 27647 = CGMCC 1.3604]|uniref:Flagellar motor protein MotS n=2 Tax=Alkalihalobacillus alcalophilus TaxID=1445 RepID=A0A094YT02_ALKAL|nr:flagellar motor protein MotS [Alkalihalobacillus alcalophilus]AEW31368.1 flagellar motor protein [Alkalihalobacillus alcalophilus]KGA96617.1 flagellar motor protein MotS [Alkalihalobacillus alcalophilus ATCC 27647 = CGMCC 1.3604]MED1561692.1 flagellar motor protein MotS [Alkalihalobacillus alcalophilus]THG92263.1 flagellar motor protein MotS [Alkalihalobacillus alcalophilus ATCC 27647 = CGMCC 1.3604]
MLRRRKQVPEKGAPKWMVTFSDLMTLILVFFVMLFSMSEIDNQRFRAMADSFNQRQVFDFMPSMIEFEHPDRDVNEAEFTESFEMAEEIKMDELLKEVDEFISNNELSEHISVTRDDRGVVLVLQERLTFESGEARLLDEAKPFLEKVGTLIEAIPNMIKVEGHTDNRPISTVRYPSNWELSGARASSVIRFLIDNNEVDPNRFMATGYGDTRPVVPNTTNENLQVNRRVVIIISDPTYEEDDTY